MSLHKHIFYISAALFIYVGSQSPWWYKYMSYSLQKQIIKNEALAFIKNGIPENEIFVLTFHKNDIKKILKWEHHREFEYRGEMYDVVETIYKGDSVSYHCHHDKRETQLNLAFHKDQTHFLSQFPLQKKTTHTQGFTLKNMFCHTDIQSIFIHAPFANNILLEIPPFEKYTYQNSYEEPFSPPPELFNKAFSHLIVF